MIINIVYIHKYYVIICDPSLFHYSRQQFWLRMQGTQRDETVEPWKTLMDYI